MNSENTVLLVKQLEKINSSRSKNSLAGAWITLLLSIVFFTSLFYRSFFPIPVNAVVWAWVLLFLFAIVLMLQSLFIIFNHIVNKRFAIIIQSILDLEKKINIQFLKSLTSLISTKLSENKNIVQSVVTPLSFS